MSDIGWTDDRVDLLRRFFENNVSVTAISKQFAISRGAVIGKLHRLGLRRERPEPRQKTADELIAAKERRRIMHNIAQNKRRAGASSQPAPVLEPALPQARAEYAPLGIPFADLEPFSQRNPNQCRYIAADEPAPEYRVCGVETAPGQPYCAHCRSLVHDYRKPTDAEQARLRHLSARMRSSNARSAA